MRRAWAGLLHQRGIWEWLVGVLLLAAFIGVLFAVAISHHDAFLRLQPVVCSQGLATRQFFIVAMAAPIAVLFMLAGVGELWLQLERRRAGKPIRWFHLTLFFGLASGLAVLVLLALGC